MLLAAAAPGWDSLPRVGRGVLHFLLVGVSTTLAISGYMALPQIEARPTRKGSWLGPLSISQAERMVGAILQSNRNRLPWPPPFEICQVGLAGLARPHAAPAEGVPPGFGVCRAH